MLDFILAAFPMHSKELLLVDRTKLVTSVLNVLLRRDMSLNRRFCTWLLGENSSDQSSDMAVEVTYSENQNLASQQSLDYFEMFSQDILIDALCAHFHSQEIRSKDNVAKAFRLIISLLDYPLIGGRILESLFLEILRFAFEMYFGFTSVSVDICDNKVDINSIENYVVSLNEVVVEHQQDIVKSIVLFFSSLDSKFVWEYFVVLYTNILVGQAAKVHAQSSNKTLRSATVSEMACLMEFILTKISLVSKLGILVIFFLWHFAVHVCDFRTKKVIE